MRSCAPSTGAPRSTWTAAFVASPEVLIALALGATAVFTARPFLYALACAGEAGVAKAFEILRDEIERSMALLGTARIGDIGRRHVEPGEPGEPPA